MGFMFMFGEIVSASGFVAVNVCVDAVGGLFMFGSGPVVANGSRLLLLAMFVVSLLRLLGAPMGPRGGRQITRSSFGETVFVQLVNGVERSNIG